MSPAERIARAVLNAYHRAGAGDAGIKAANEAAARELRPIVREAVEKISAAVADVKQEVDSERKDQS